MLVSVAPSWARGVSRSLAGARVSGAVVSTRGGVRGRGAPGEGRAPADVMAHAVAQPSPHSPRQSRLGAGGARWTPSCPPRCSLRYHRRRPSRLVRGRASGCRRGAGRGQAGRNPRDGEANLSAAVPFASSPGHLVVRAGWSTRRPGAPPLSGTRVAILAAAARGLPIIWINNSTVHVASPRVPSGVAQACGMRAQCGVGGGVVLLK